MSGRYRISLVTGSARGTAVVDSCRTPLASLAAYPRRHGKLDLFHDSDLPPVSRASLASRRNMLILRHGPVRDAAASEPIDAGTGDDFS